MQSVFSSLFFLPSAPFLSNLIKYHCRYVIPGSKVSSRSPWLIAVSLWSIFNLLSHFIGLPFIGLSWWIRWQSLCLQCGRPMFDPWVGKIPWRRKWQPTLVLLPGKFHGPRGSSEPGRLQSIGSQRVGHDWVTSVSLSLFSCS